MIWLYRILFLPGLLLASPYYLYRMRKRGGYKKDWPQRLGLLPPLPPKKPGVNRIWLQAVSVGEIQAIEPLLQSLHSHPDYEIFLTTTTSTGYALARERWAEQLLGVGLFPLDFWPSTRRAWHQIQPDGVLLMESELWPELIHQASKRDVPVALLNARLSDRSFQRYQAVRGIARWVLSRVSVILAASAQDQDRFGFFLEGGKFPELTGNLKFDLNLEPVLSAEEQLDLRQELGFSQEGDAAPLVLLGSSTWPGEEKFLLEILKESRARDIDLHLLLVPRHAERGGELESLLKESGVSWHRRSRERTAPAGTCIYLADTTGELRLFTQIADLAFIGKTLPPHTQGQTPIECAAFGIPLVTGPGIGNFRQAVLNLQKAQGCLTGRDASEVKRMLNQLLDNPREREMLSHRARQWLLQNRGSTERTLSAIHQLFPTVHG